VGWPIANIFVPRTLLRCGRHRIAGLPAIDAPTPRTQLGSHLSLLPLPPLSLLSLFPSSARDLTITRTTHNHVRVPPWVLRRKSQLTKGRQESWLQPTRAPSKFCLGRTRPKLWPVQSWTGDDVSRLSRPRLTPTLVIDGHGGTAVLTDSSSAPPLPAERRRGPPQW
jgi:hypothetical protein